MTLPDAAPRPAEPVKDAPPPLVPGLTVHEGGEGGGTLSLASGRTFRVSAETVWLVRRLQAPATWESIAAGLSERVGAPVTPAQARALVHRVLGRHGIAGPSPDAEEGPRGRDVLAGTWVRRLSVPLTPLLRRGTLGITAAVAAGAHVAWLAYTDVAAQCLGDARRELLWLPAALVPALLAHELGHAAAFRALGGKPGPLRLAGPRARLSIALPGIEGLAAGDRATVLLAGAVAQLAWGTTWIVAFAAAGVPPPAFGALANLLAVAANLAPIGDRDGARVSRAWAGPPGGPTGPQLADESTAVRDRTVAATVAFAVSATLGIAVALHAPAALAAGPAAWLIAGAAACAALSFAVLGLRLVDRLLGAEGDAHTEVAPRHERWAGVWIAAARAARVTLVMELARGALRRERALLPVLTSFAFPERSSRALHRLGRRSAVSIEMLHHEHGDLAHGSVPHVMRHAGVVRELIASRQGALICGLHFGPFHYLVRALLRMGIKPVVFAAPSTQRHWDVTWKRAIGPSEHDPDYVDPTQPAGTLRAFRALRSGRLVVVYMDAQIAAGGAQERRVPVRFLGQTVYMRSGPMVLASRAGVPVVLGATPRRAFGMRLVAFSPAYAPPADDDADTIARYLEERYAWFEPWVARYPEQWAGNLLRLDHWREAGAPPTVTATAWNEARAAWRARLERPGRARLAVDTARVGWIESRGERLVIDGPRGRVLRGAPLTLELLDAAARRAPVARLARGRAPEPIADELARLTLAGLVQVREPRRAPPAAPAVPAPATPG